LLNIYIKKIIFFSNKNKNSLFFSKKFQNFIAKKRISRNLFKKPHNSLKMESETTINTINLSNYNLSSWYPLFKSISLKSRIIPTNLRFFTYLSSDGIYIHPKYRKSLSKTSLDLDQISETMTKPSNFDGISNRNNEDFSSNQDIFSEESSIFPEFDEEILKILKEFDNKVFVKLNWKAPKDIDTWVPHLLCQSIEEVFLALKSSSIIGEMLENFFPKIMKNDEELKENGGLQIILKKWYDLNKSMEFRVFVRNEGIIGISQRYMKNSYGFLKEKEYQGKIEEKITEFFKGNFVRKFLDKSFVFDVYIEIRGDLWKIWLIDINPWGNLTNPLMFKWEELEKIEGKVVFRVIEDNNTMILEKNMGICQVPEEFNEEFSGENVKKWVDLLGNGGIIE